jgi:hypothetical protein
MAWLPVNIAMILGHQDLTLGEGIDPRNPQNYGIAALHQQKHGVASCSNAIIAISSVYVDCA